MYVMCELLMTNSSFKLSSSGMTAKSLHYKNKELERSVINVIYTVSWNVATM